MTNDASRFFAARHLGDRLVQEGLAPLFREIILDGDGKDFDAVREQIAFWQQERTPREPDIDAVMLGALGYALGRMTTAVSTVADDIKANWPVLSEQTRTEIRSRIQEALENGRAGMDVDREVWGEIFYLDMEAAAPAR